MHFNKQFYKYASFYFALCFLGWPIVITIFQPENLFVNFFQLLFAFLGLVGLIYIVFFDSDDTGDWIIAGQGRHLKFNRHFYRRGNFYFGLFLIFVSLPIGTGLNRWENITYIVLGVVFTAGALIKRTH
ncbi:hypothetical protein [Limosilactobacillus antri]|uniref:Uncharacterized protein n=1 Tax=Limosilactobacillus antri DSM 16041 TaxID=525309 RepID=C8P4Q7_9LACO|nr:hypothetical protein [Limosilactobacillus antri]EEW54559.1 hypothetical protein HMPREF0494_0301 [Limosilactobacillus antri DSM 16041]KRK57534.1 hypothetical protein FC31_GL001007 [Limosilactobacillus antri DSM 16041]